MSKILITGHAGFIGMHTAMKLLADGHDVIGIDALTDYYDISLKQARLNKLAQFPQFKSVIMRLEDEVALKALFEKEKPEYVIHLAAQAGVRYSIDAPRSYVDSNILGAFSLLEAIRAYPVKHLLFASTSSVYGANKEMPYQETHKADSQMSFYAATKKANEAMCHSYAHLYQIPTTMFRFFTVYGPWGRPDMALFKFTKAILADEAIDVYNNGKLSRDFTYIDDIVNGISHLMMTPPLEAVNSDSKSAVAPYRICNIGNSEPTRLLNFIETLEKVLGKEAQKNFLEMQAGDVYDTWAETSLINTLTGFQASTSLEEGITAFVNWYKEYYKV